MFNQFATPEKALDYLLDQGEKSLWGSARIWIEHRSITGGKVCGSRPITRAMIKDRLYIVTWCNDSVAIEFLDSIWMDGITGRSYPEQTRCQVVKLPTNERL